MLHHRNLAALAGTLGIAALAVSPIAAGAGTRSVKGTCTEKLQQGPGSTLVKGTENGTASCSKPIGKGTIKSTYSDTITGSAIKSDGKAVLTLKNGTINSTTKLTGTVAAKTTLSGTATITGGTKAYKKAHGVQKLTCVTSDFGKHLDCTQTGTISGI